MRKLIVLVGLFTVTSLYSQQDQTIKLIHEEMETINSMELFIIPIKMEQECGGISYNVFLDSKQRIRKFTYDYFEGCATEDGFAYTEYFNEMGELVFKYFFYLSTNKKPVGLIKGSIYFKNKRPIKEDIRPYHYTGKIEKDTGDQYKTFFTRAYNKHSKWEYCSHLTSKSINEQFRVLNKNVLKPLKKGDVLCVNNNDVLLRKNPSLDSEVILKLSAYNKIEFLEKGKSQYIEKWGEHYWYKVKHTHNQASPKTGWVFSAFIDPSCIP